MNKFEIVSKYAEAGLSLPKRKTKEAAGYDFAVAEDTIIEPYPVLLEYLTRKTADIQEVMTLDKMADLTKETSCHPTLVPTGIKCQLDPGYYLELSARSSSPLKYWLILANGEGIIDGDYYNNPTNEGDICFQLINLSPLPILLKKGDIIGQGIIKHYNIVDDEFSPKAPRTGGFGSTGSNVNG